MLKNMAPTGSERRPNLTGGGLRREVSARSLARASASAHEVSYGRTPSVVYAEGEGGHGNFLSASYRRILAHGAWAQRLNKSYTGAGYLPRAGDRWRGELECASSSDALLMNVFCYPGVLRRASTCALLGVEPGLQPDFGVRAELPMRNGEVDRTELDMRLGSTFAEAKLTEGGFGQASRERLLRYLGVEEAFAVEELPRGGRGFVGYQILRGVLAALATEGHYLVLLDSRRADLQEMCFRVLGAARGAEVRHRLRLRTWQELAATLPRTLQTYLAERFGIAPENFFHDR